MSLTYYVTGFVLLAAFYFVIFALLYDLAPEPGGEVSN